MCVEYFDVEVGGILTYRSFKGLRASNNQCISQWDLNFVHSEENREYIIAPDTQPVRL